MKTTLTIAAASCLTALACPLAAQTAPVPAPSTTSSVSNDGTVVLSPFEVTADSETGYQATETLAGTRIRTDLRDVGSAIQVITKEFMKDVGATDNATLLQYTTNAEVAGTRGTYAGLGNGTNVEEIGSLRAPGSANRVRGLAAADNTRDFFVTDIPWDGFNVDRIDIQRGPNSILFGLGSPAGIVNAAMRNAEFRDVNATEIRFGSYDSLRASLDLNKELIAETLALRISALRDHEKFQQNPAYENDERIYAAVRFDPQLFADRSFRTSLKFKFEHGEIEANRPRTVSPNDSITPWFRPVDTTSLQGGMGKFSVNNSYELGAAPASANPWLAGAADQQQPIWFIDGTTNQLQRIYAGYINTGARNANGTLRGSGENLIGQRYADQFYRVNSLSAYATNARIANAQYGQFRTASLQDASVFDFYNTLIDGPTKNEFEEWDAYNLSLTQTGWDDRVGLELNYDRQKYLRGGQALLGTPTLTIDILRNFQDQTANPNYGRPYVAGGAGGGTSYESDREYVRAALFGELRASDFVDADGFLAKLLGKHRFNGAYSGEEYLTENRTWQMYANPRDWDAYWSRTDGSGNGINNRAPVGVIYLGSSLASASSAAGADIPGIGAPVDYADGNVYHFASTWTNPTGVNFTDPWTVPANLAPLFNAAALPAGQTGFLQNSNPANYVGWNSNRQINLMRYNNGEDLSLLTGAQKQMRKTTSYAGSWQGFLWNDAIIPTLGWRYDEVKGKGVIAQPNNANRAIRNLAPDVYRLPDTFPQSQIFKDHSTSGGVVVHLNRLLGDDPLPINVSLSYNKSNNFQVTDTRRDIYGTPIGNPTGNTEEYGVLLSTRDNRFSFRAVKYETKITNATTQLSVDGLRNTIRDGMNWRNILLYQMSGYNWDSRNNPAQRNLWTPAYVDANGRSVARFDQPQPAGSTLQTEAEAIAMRDEIMKAWNDIQKYLEPKGFFSAWNYGAGPTTSSVITDRSTYEANPGAFQPNPASVFDYRTVSNLQGFAVTADTQSEGYEFELTANPTRNWRIAVNAGKATAVRTNVGGAVLDELVSYMDGQIAGRAGDLRRFNASYDGPGNELRTEWSNWRGQYTLLKLQEGAAASELRKWRYNVVTNYSFDEGRLKGFGIGGSYRWQDRVVIGYPVIPGTAGQAGFDLDRPFYGPSEDAFDAWLSYERKLTDRIGWKIQLNGRNLFAKEELIPISVQPDGTTWASARIAPNREWFVTNSFTF